MYVFQFEVIPMTLSELLVELKAVDPDTADDIGDIVAAVKKEKR